MRLYVAVGWKGFAEWMVSSAKEIGSVEINGNVVKSSSGKKKFNIK
jgi:hypothetical protein